MCKWSHGIGLPGPQDAHRNPGLQAVRVGERNEPNLNLQRFNGDVWVLISEYKKHLLLFI